MKKFVLLAAIIMAGAYLGLSSAQAQILYIPSYPSTHYYYQDRDYCVGSGFVIATPGFYACINDRNNHRYGYPYRSNRFMYQRHYVYPKYQIEHGHWGRNDRDRDRHRRDNGRHRGWDRDDDHSHGRGDGRSLGRHR